MKPWHYWLGWFGLWLVSHVTLYITVRFAVVHAHAIIEAQK